MRNYVLAFALLALMGCGPAPPEAEQTVTVKTTPQVPVVTLYHGSVFQAYKMTVDGVEYIVVDDFDALAIIRHTPAAAEEE